MSIRSRFLAGLLFIAAACLTGAGCPADDGLGSQVSSGQPGGDGGESEGAGGGAETGEVSGTFTPGQDLELQSTTMSFEVPAEAADEAVTLTMRGAEVDDLPEALPGNVGFTGAVFGPDGQSFSPPATLTLQLGSQSLAPSLPVLTYDQTAGRWVGTGVNATVADDGLTASFLVPHFSILGLPDPIPIPEPGDDIGSFVVISNNGTFSSNEISSDTASLLYSEFGDTFSLSVTEGPSAAMGLTAVHVREVGPYVIGVLAGGLSIYNDGGQNESVFGVMVMSVSGSNVTVCVYAATTQRVISGTLTGQTP